MFHWLDISCNTNVEDPVDVVTRSGGTFGSWSRTQTLRAAGIDGIAANGNMMVWRQNDDYQHSQIKFFMRSGATWSNFRTELINPGYDSSIAVAGNVIAAADSLASIGSVEQLGNVHLYTSGFTDCDGDGVSDQCEIAKGNESDINWNGMPDTCENVGAPTNFSASDGLSTTSTSLSWSVTPGVIGYRVYRALPGSTLVQIATTTVPYFNDASVSPGIVYAYSVTARYPGGDSGQSTIDTGWRNVAAPGTVTATDGTSTVNVTVTWTGVSGATGYKVFRAIGSEAAVQVGGNVAASTLSAVDTTAIAGTLYSYSVKAMTGAGDSGASAIDTGWRNVVAPASVNATDGTSAVNVTVTWTGVSGATGYKVFRSIGGETAVQVGGNVAASTLSAVDTTAVASTLYSYSVKAMTGAGDSGVSAIDTGWRNVAAPGTVNATDGTSTVNVTITWAGVSGATGYKVFRAIGSGAAVQVGSNVAASTLSAVDATAVAGTLYSYSVKAMTGVGDSGFSTVNTGWRNVAAPGTVNATDGTSAVNVTIAWTGVSGATGYKVFRAIGSGTAVQIGGNVAASTLSAVDATAIGGTLYSYSVKAITGAGDSGFSAVNTGWRNVAAPGTVNATDGTSAVNVTVTWTGVTGATGYKVFRAIGSGAAVQVGGNVAASTLSAVDTTAVAGTLYSYSVKAMTGVGDSGFSAVNTGWRNVAAPGTVNATDGTSAVNVTITWTGVSGATGYKVFRAIGSGTAVQVGGNVAASTLSAVDATAVAGTLYSYSIKAMTGAGDSAVSAVNTGWRNVAAPGTVNATDGTSAVNVTVTWAGVSGATGYKVFRAIGSGAAVQVGGNVAASTLSAVDTTAIAGTLYSYSVKSMTATGDSAVSAMNTGWRNVVAPASVNATDGTSTVNVTITWTGVSGATGYKVFRAIGSGTAVQVGGNVAASTLSAVDTTAIAGTLYSYSVKAMTGAGDSAVSAMNTGWRNVVAPASVTATDGDFSTHVRVSWGIASAAQVNGYRVFRKLPTETEFAAIATLSGRTTVVYNDTSIPSGVIGTYKTAAITSPGESVASLVDTGFRSASFRSLAGNDDIKNTGGRMEPVGDGSSGRPIHHDGTSTQHDGASSDSGTQPGVAPVTVTAQDQNCAVLIRPTCEEIEGRIAQAATHEESDSVVMSDQWLLELQEVRAGGGASMVLLDQQSVSRACLILRGDVNLDGRIDAADLDNFLDACQFGDLIRADINRDGSINITDLILLLDALQVAINDVRTSTDRHGP
jgi:hypothetical protein